jgi:hypothetical protein
MAKLTSAFLLLLLLITGCSPRKTLSAQFPSLPAARRDFKTALLPQKGAIEPVEQAPASLFRTIKYPAPGGELAAYLSPDPGDGKKHPAIIWITGGDCNSIGDVWSLTLAANDQSARQYRNVGIVMMFPSLRGGNDNPGTKEGYYGEVDDVIAATGFQTPLQDLPDLGLVTVADGRIPALTPFWESVSLPGVFFAGNASIAASRDGVVHLVWVDTRSGSQQIWTKRYVPGSGWTADQQLVLSPMSSSAPSINADWHNHMHLVWSDTRDGNNEVYYKEYVPGAGWDALDTRVTVNASAQTQPYVDADPLGNVYTVWTDSRNGASNPDIYYDTRQTGVWVGNTPLVYSATDPSNSVQRFPGIVHDDFGFAYVAWSDERLPATLGKNKEVFYKVGVDVVTAVDVSEKPALGRLLRNYPNPFNPVTRIQFVLDRNTQVSLRAFDVQGRVVRTLLNSYLTAGPRVVNWDGRDDRGRPLPSGTYFLRLQGGGTYLTRTVNLVK